MLALWELGSLGAWGGRFVGVYWGFLVFLLGCLPAVNVIFSAVLTEGDGDGGWQLSVYLFIYFFFLVFLIL